MDSTGAAPSSGPLSPAYMAAFLRASGAALRAEWSGLPPEAFAWHPAPGEWCANEVLGHLIEAEQRGFAGRIRQILATDTRPLERWDPAEVARARRDCERDPAALLAEFLPLRESSLALIAALREPDLARAGDHPTVGRLTVSDLLHEWVHHDRNHLKQILTAVQMLVWPHMGNTQRFSSA